MTNAPRGSRSLRVSAVGGWRPGAVGVGEAGGRGAGGVRGCWRGGGEGQACRRGEAAPCTAPPPPPSTAPVRVVGVLLRGRDDLGHLQAPPSRRGGGGAMPLCRPTQEQGVFRGANTHNWAWQEGVHTPYDTYVHGKRYFTVHAFLPSLHVTTGCFDGSEPAEVPWNARVKLCPALCALAGNGW